MSEFSEIITIDKDITALDHATLVTMTMVALIGLAVSCWIIYHLIKCVLKLFRNERASRRREEIRLTQSAKNEREIEKKERKEDIKDLKDLVTKIADNVNQFVGATNERLAIIETKQDYERPRMNRFFRVKKKR